MKKKMGVTTVARAGGGAFVSFDLEIASCCIVCVELRGAGGTRGSEKGVVCVCVCVCLCLYIYCVQDDARVRSVGCTGCGAVF